MSLFFAFQVLFPLLERLHLTLGISLIGWTVGFAGLIYCYELFYKRKWKIILRRNIWLVAFIAQGLLWCVLSLAGMAGWFNLRREFAVNLEYLPRQAFYLALLPLVAVLPLSDSTPKCMELLRKYGNICSAAEIAIACLVHWEDRLIIPDILLAGFFLFMGWKGRIWDWGLALLILGFPLPPYGTSTVVILKIVFLGLLLFKDRKWVIGLASCALPVVLLGSFVLPQFPQLWEKIPDPNTVWRLEYWQDETTAILDTYGVGIGFGTTYASREFSEPQSARTWIEENQEWSITPFSSNEKYTKEQRPFVTASHNSFVGVTFRQGMLGLILLLGVFATIWKRTVQRASPDRRAKIFAFCGILITMCFNVVFESIGYIGLVMLFAGICNSDRPETEGNAS